MPSIGKTTPKKKHQKIEFYQSKFPTRDHPKKYRDLYFYKQKIKMVQRKKLEDATVFVRIAISYP